MSWVGRHPVSSITFLNFYYKVCTETENEGGAIFDVVKMSYT